MAQVKIMYSELKAMCKIIVLLLVAGAWFAGYLSSSVYGAGIPGPGEEAPVILDLNKFGEEILRADRWFSLRDSDNTKGANVSLATKPEAGKCLKIDYKGENTFWL